ncbi:ATP-dependent 6-phosphofructokinase [Bythopirellula polymerisocia]|uniref:Pyrophosphate--fructose 6-phosphate 1-phosphotransferase n=1 Tax=Bythopirellula polymerisocia TaxID=2528003 RepID=A0A5C6CYH0_9BACT|nr:ATP-dependent 6-phosphofructokinase [Bythopirellula polymerisocia]TWU29983.1 Pyrophosphate--fructose 6-phosphate 1-phosphotransferase [Bythopirellula polymerisocia]
MPETPDLTQQQLSITSLGEPSQISPLPLSTVPGDDIGDFVEDDTHLFYEPRFKFGEKHCDLSFEMAGARREIFFHPADTTAAIVTCGGLCPGINNVIRSLVMELLLNYGIQNVLGIRYGYHGLNPTVGRPPIELTAELVDDIHHKGGTILGTSRGHQEAKETVDFLVSRGINILFCVGGDGTQRGAHQIALEIARRKLSISVVGIPKTIDNDIKYCYRTFGYATAVSEAEKVIDRAHVEARSVLNGVGLVKLMGRHAGFIAASATLASGVADFALIPEVPMALYGEHGFLAALQRRLKAREHAVVVVAEGAGQHWLDECPAEFDASGNLRLRDIGPFLAEAIKSHSTEVSSPVSVKYFDPSYHIRSVPADAADSLLCEKLARSAAHAGMSGKTDMLIGLWHNHLIHVPLTISCSAKKQLSPEGELWMAVEALTRQQKWYLGE